MPRSRPAVIEVCDALQRIDQLDGKVVAVRGYYRFGMELGGLYGRNCPKKLILDHTERAQAFDLRFAPTVDQARLDDAASQLIGEKNVREAIQVTLVGVLKARRGDLIDIDGKKARMFGHLGVYPAQIIVLSRTLPSLKRLTFRQIWTPIADFECGWLVPAETRPYRTA